MPSQLQAIAAAVVIAAGLLLIALAVMSVARPAIVRRFLLGFAQTQSAHYIEMAARITVGVALVIASPRVLLSQFFFWFGVALLASSLILICLPWKWHRSLGERVLPRFVNALGIVSAVSLLLGGLLVAATVAGVV